MKKGNKIRLDNIEDKRELRRLVMTFFDKPQLSRNMTSHDHFKKIRFTEQQVRTMMHSLDMTGLIHLIRGAGPGAVYGLTDDGAILMQAMEIAERKAKEREES